jgi:CBS domain-containing membrane protein
MNVSDVMSRKVVAIPPTATFREVWRSLFKNKVNSLPVIDKKRHLLGIITREELLERLYPDYQDLFASSDEFPDFEEIERKVSEPSDLKAQGIMRRHVVFTHEDTAVMRALSRMIVRRINQLPVVTPDEVLVGMITKGDIFYSVFKKYMKRHPKEVRKEKSPKMKHAARG